MPVHIYVSDAQLRLLRKKKCVAFTHINNEGKYILNIEKIPKELLTMIHYKYENDIVYDQWSDVCMFDSKSQVHMTNM
jgi:hypothetical protein